MFRACQEGVRCAAGFNSGGCRHRGCWCCGEALALCRPGEGQEAIRDETDVTFLLPFP